MNNKKYYGRKIVIKYPREREVFIDIHRDLRTARQHGNGPYYELTFKESEEHLPGNYWGWENPTEGYIFIHPMKSGIEIYFSHGTKSEEEKGNGKLVELVLESKIQIE